LGGFNGDFSSQLSDLSVQNLDFVLGFVLFVGVVGDGSVEGGNGVSTFLFLSNVFGISIGLLGGQVLSNFSQHSGNIS
jgi:small-conductance mechanosensitive channel